MKTLPTIISSIFLWQLHNDNLLDITVSVECVVLWMARLTSTNRFILLGASFKISFLAYFKYPYLLLITSIENFRELNVGTTCQIICRFWSYDLPIANRSLTSSKWRTFITNVTVDWCRDSRTILQNNNILR